jgi:hypothetical protein
MGFVFVDINDRKNESPSPAARMMEMINASTSLGQKYSQAELKFWSATLKGRNMMRFARRWGETSRHITQKQDKKLLD